MSNGGEKNVEMIQLSLPFYITKFRHSNGGVCTLLLCDVNAFRKTSLSVSPPPQVLKVAILAEKYAVDYTWYVDTILNLIRMAGDHVSEEVWYRVIQIVINRDDVQGYAAKTVFEVSADEPARASPSRASASRPVNRSQALQAPACHENLVKVGGYILGEFGNLIAGDPRSRYPLFSSSSYFFDTTEKNETTASVRNSIVELEKMDTPPTKINKALTLACCGGCRPSARWSSSSCCTPSSTCARCPRARCCSPPTSSSSTCSRR